MQKSGQSRTTACGAKCLIHNLLVMKSAVRAEFPPRLVPAALCRGLEMKSNGKKKKTKKKPRNMKQMTLSAFAPAGFKLITRTLLISHFHVCCALR